jgi:hypothetical protein
MRVRPDRSLAAGAALVGAVVLGWPGVAAAKHWGADLTPPGVAGSAKGIDLLREGWSQFADGWLIVDMVLVMLFALLLGAVIAYHPATRRRVSSLEHFEQPKTFLMYAVVASVVALIVTVQPAMAFVIFGIGGLLRFRTMVGEAKDTGRVILVTVVGLCCGLKIFIVAVPATIIGWILIQVLERETAGIVRVSGVSEAAIADAARAYRAAIAATGCRIIGEQTKFVRREFAFVVQASPSVAREDLIARFEALPPDLRGVVDFERL